MLSDLRYGPEEVVGRVCGRLSEALEEPLLLAGDEVRVEPVIGHAAFPADADDAATLLALAAQAAHAATPGTAPSRPWHTESSSAAGHASSGSTPLRSTRRSI
jgi:hypothetical protein